ncbi:Ohr family peroxiredoxin [Maliponia aquimaris]|jgi:Ohr subfamily peroxiredoxin|uniref:Organic hydroperoxide resistance protein OhrB n=1 Tax=Maliponia aquimaris TaxID=1673631 RepID=A0A238JQV9_9RHOB|nr:Ohr family peroxiredoxin [Maliponia aquimaris]SMX33068.1 Organic hydroperoxide resistance protein OhrB [Maliponia aquimaris]
MTPIYATSCTATHEARNGSVRSADGALDVKLAMPRELGGPGGATNPEQLFAAGYAACFTSALLLVARESTAQIGKPAVTVKSGLRSDGPGRFALFAEVHVALPDLDRDAALRLARGAHQVCPFSKAVGHSLGVTVTLTDWHGARTGETLGLEVA